jgi:hypothetical protein
VSGLTVRLNVHFYVVCYEGFSERWAENTFSTYYSLKILWILVAVELLICKPCYKIAVNNNYTKHPICMLIPFFSFCIKCYGRTSTVLSVSINLLEEKLIKFNFPSILQILGYKFRNLYFVIQALTRKSKMIKSPIQMYKNEHNWSILMLRLWESNSAICDAAHTFLPRHFYDIIKVISCRRV